MKEKIMVFVIGLLVGAVIATGAFYVYTNANTCSCGNNQMMGGTPPEMPSGQNGQPPEKPSGDMQPPEMPNTQNNG